MPFLDVPPIPARALQKRRITRIITKGNVIDWFTWSKAGQLHSGGLQAGGAENQVATQSKNQKPHNKGNPWCSPSMRVGGSPGKDDVSAHWEARSQSLAATGDGGRNTHIRSRRMKLAHPGKVCLPYAHVPSGLLPVLMLSTFRMSYTPDISKNTFTDTPRKCALLVY